MKKSYYLKLADNQVFEFVSDNSTSEWLKEFSRILKFKSDLKGIQDTTKIFFSYRSKKISGEEILVYRKNLIKIFKEGDKFYCILKNKRSLANYFQMYFSLYIIFKYVEEQGGLILHSGLIEKDKKSYLIAAHGAHGKSTACKRVGSPWNSLCDDNVCISFSENNFYASPLPTWSEYFYNISKGSWDTGKFYEIGAIFFLEQSKGAKILKVNKSESIGRINNFLAGSEQIKKMIEGRNISSSYRIEMFKNSCKLIDKVPCFRLLLDKTSRYWEQIEEFFNTN